MTQQAAFINDSWFETQKMDSIGAIVFNSFFPGKFSPPRVDPNFHLNRKNTIEQFNKSNHQVISIKARAGQGKSILAAQFLQSIKAEFAWIQLDSSDRDPVVFIAAIFTALMKVFPELDKSVVYEMILKDEVIEEETIRLAPALLNDLSQSLKQTFYFVIDDLHLLKESSKSLSFIESIISNAPPLLRFILISRYSVDMGTIFKNALQLNNSSLALSQGDVAELFVKIFKKPLPAKVVTALHQNTEGWVMGLILAGHALTNKFDFKPPARLNNLMPVEPDKLGDYFQSEILSSFSPSDRRKLLTLALLDDIPLNLAEYLFLTTNISQFLEYLVHKNFFLRRIEDDPVSYCFHHFFQEFLRYEALKELSEKEQRILWAKSGRWHLRQNRFEQALNYYLKARSYGMVERILQEFGLQLKGTNRTALNVETIKTIPPEIIENKGWIALTAAAVYSTSEPLQSKMYLHTAHQKFISQKNEIGEILTIAALITYHVGVDCNFKKGKKLLSRAIALYDALGEKISVAARIHIASAIAYGLCYFEGRFELAARYTEKIIEMAQKRGLYDAMAMGVVARGLVCNFDGNWHGFQKLIEESLFLMQSARVNNLNKFSIAALQMVALAHQLDIVTCTHYRRLIELTLDPKLLSKTFFGSLLVNFDVSISIVENRLQDAKIHLQKGLESGGANVSPHIQGMFWGRYAYVYALQKDDRNALEALEKSFQLRNEVGGAFFDIVTKINVGSVHALLENYDVAENFLAQAISEIKLIGPSPIIISVYFYRAFIHLKSGDISAGIEDLKSFLSWIKHFRYPYFQNFNAAILKELLTAALLNNIEPENARWIARKYLQTLISDSGEHFPLLEIKTLGSLEFKLEGVSKITFGDLTKTQRELLALLISSPPDKGVPHNVIQEAFWPDSSAKKTRSKLDNSFARLRKVFNALLAPYPANNYLCMKKGYVSLKNCTIDAHIFEQNVKEGLHHLKTNKFWQAGNEFLKAYLLYSGEFLPGIYLNDPFNYVRENIQSYFIQCSINWAGLLSAGGRISEAIFICQKAILYDPGNEPLVKLLYRLFDQNNDIVQARKVITSYRRVLEKDGFADEEIEEIMNNLMH